jgi:hypothetical protein
MAVTSAAKFLILDPASPLRAVLPVADCSLPAVRVVLARIVSLVTRILSAFDPEPNWEDGDVSHASRMQRVGEAVF